MKQATRILPKTQLIREILAKLGNNKPSQKQIDLAETILYKTTINQELTFNNRLTKREISCLLLAAKGKTRQQTAELLNIQTVTVDSYRKKIHEKLQSKSMAQAVFEGIRYGYVQPKMNKASSDTPTSKEGI